MKACVAVGVWFGGGDYRRTETLITSILPDFADVNRHRQCQCGFLSIGAMHGMAAFPPELVDSFKDRIKGDKLGPVTITPPVDESISGLGDRTAAVGEKILLAHGAKLKGGQLVIQIEQPQTQAPELFKLADLTKLWNRPEWELERAGYGGSTGGISGIRGQTYLDGDTLAVFPRDEVTRSIAP